MYGDFAQICLCSWGPTMQDIPASNSFSKPLKNGFLLKLTGRGWLYSGSWKRRYCVLDGSKFYFYENEQSKGSEKSCGVINLDYYDVCEENSDQDKKNPHVFVIGTSVRGFFDNRHQFSADTASEMQAWIQAVKDAITEARTSRRKANRKRQQDGKSPDLSSSSQESETTTRLVNATKDRAKGPQGRRLPQRKSMMPTARSAEENDLRQRSISVSTPSAGNPDDGDASPRLQSSSEKWISISMEEMDRDQTENGDDSVVNNQRSSSTFDIPQQKETTATSDGYTSTKPSQIKSGLRFGKLGGQHAALTKELEMKLKAGKAPGVRRLPSVDPEEDDKKEDSDKKIECLNARVDLAKDSINVLEERMNLLTNKVENSSEKSEKARTEMDDLLQQAQSTVKDAERINRECKLALADVERARSEYVLLVKECKDTLAKLQSDCAVHLTNLHLN